MIVATRERVLKRKYALLYVRAFTLLVLLVAVYRVTVFYGSFCVPANGLMVPLSALNAYFLCLAIADVSERRFRAVE